MKTFFSNFSENYKVHLGSKIKYIDEIATEIENTIDILSAPIIDSKWDNVKYVNEHFVLKNDLHFIYLFAIVKRLRCLYNNFQNSNISGEKDLYEFEIKLHQIICLTYELNPNSKNLFNSLSKHIPIPIAILRDKFVPTLEIFPVSNIHHVITAAEVYTQTFFYIRNKKKLIARGMRYQELVSFGKKVYDKKLCDLCKNIGPGNELCKGQGFITTGSLMN